VTDGGRLQDAPPLKAKYASVTGVYEPGANAGQAEELVRVVGSAFEADDRGYEIGDEPVRLQARARLPLARSGQVLWDSVRNLALAVNASEASEFPVCAFDGTSGAETWTTVVRLLPRERGKVEIADYAVRADLGPGVLVLTDNWLPPLHNLAVIDTSCGRVAWRGQCYDKPIVVGRLVCVTRDDGRWQLVDSVTGAALHRLGGSVTGPFAPAVAVSGDRIYWSPDEHSVCGAVRVSAKGK